MAEPLAKRKAQDEDKKDKRKKQEDAPVEKWRPHENYDKFRQPGFWRGDEVTPNAKPATRIEKKSSLPVDKAVQTVASKGRNGDSELAHITPKEKMLLASLGGSGTRNPETGLLEFFEGSDMADSHGSNSTGQAGNNSGVGSEQGGKDESQRALDAQIAGGIGPFNNPNNTNITDVNGEDFNYTNPNPPNKQNEFDKTNNWGLGIGDSTAFAGFSPGVMGAVQYAATVGVEPAMAGIGNSVNNLSFADIAGFAAGALVGAVAGPLVGGAVTGVAGPAIGAAANMVTSRMAGQAVDKAVTSAVNNGLPSSPTTQASNSITGQPSGSPQGLPERDSGDSQTERVAPITSPTDTTVSEIKPLATRPTTTVADANQSYTGIVIPPYNPATFTPLAVRYNV